MKGKKKRASSPGPIAGSDVPIPGPVLRGNVGARAGEETGSSVEAGASPPPPGPESSPPSAARDPTPAALAPLAPGREVLDALRARLAERVPGWASRPEDPVQVILEVVAGWAGNLREEIAGIEARAVPGLLAWLGLEPRPPRPARLVAAFEPDPALLAGPGGTVTVPAGTPLVAIRPRDASEPVPARAAFETSEAIVVGGARLARAVAVDGNDVREVPVVRPVPSPLFPPDPPEHLCSGRYPTAVPAGRASTGGTAVAVFGDRLRAGRELYLGDPGLAELRSGGSLRIDWPGYPRHLATERWEYSAAGGGAAGGWRALPVRFERVPGETPILRLTVRGPLPDLANEVRERADLPWIRCTLPPGGLDIPSPVLGKGDREPGKSGEGKPFSRVFLAGTLESIDLSFEEHLRADPPSADLDPAIYLGWDGPAFSSVLFLADGWPGAEEALDHAGSSRFSWEFSSGDGWTEFPAGRLQDTTGKFARRGIIAASPGSAWVAAKLFGEDLWWVRARWTSGDRGRPVAISLLLPAAVEAVQGRTIDDLALGRASAIRDGTLDLPRLSEGEVEGIGRIEFRRAGGSSEIWELAEGFQGLGPSDARFSIARRPDGRLSVRFGDGVRGRRPPEGDLLVAGRQVRVGIGAHGNLPAGTTLALDAPIPGIASAWCPLPAGGGADLETLDALKARASAEWMTGGRAVTAEDFDRLVRGLLPGAAGAIAAPDKDRPGGVVVIPIPGRTAEPGRFPPGLLGALEAELQARAPLGTPVRVAEPSFRPVEADVAARPGADREALRDRAAQEIRKVLDPLRPIAPGGRIRLNETDLASIMVPVFGRPIAVRIASKDGRRLSLGASGGPADPILRLERVRFEDEPGDESGI